MNMMFLLSIPIVYIALVATYYVVKYIRTNHEPISFNRIQRFLLTSMFKAQHIAPVFVLTITLFVGNYLSSVAPDVLNGPPFHPRTTKYKNPFQPALMCFVIAKEEDGLNPFVEEQCTRFPSKKPSDFSQIFLLRDTFYKNVNQVELSSIASHVSVLQNAHERGQKYIQVLEYGAYPMHREYWPTNISNLIQTMEIENLDFILLYSLKNNYTHPLCYPSDIQPKNVHLQQYIRRKHFGTSAYLVNVDSMLSQLENLCQRKFWFLSPTDIIDFTCIDNIENLYVDAILWEGKRGKVHVPALYGDNTSLSYKNLNISHVESMKSLEKEWNQHKCIAEFGKTKECMCAKTAFLILTSTKSSSLGKWSNFISNIDFTFVNFHINVWDKSDENFSHNLPSSVKITYFPGLKIHFWKMIDPDYDYEYMWFIDDDFDFTQETIESFYRNIQYYQPLISSPAVVEKDKQNCQGENGVCRHKSTKHIHHHQLLEMNWIEIDSFVLSPSIWEILKNNLLIFDVPLKNGSMWGPDCVWCGFLKEYFGESRIACMLDPTNQLVHVDGKSFTGKSNFAIRQEIGQLMIQKYENKTNQSHQCFSHSMVVRKWKKVKQETESYRK